jgi:hypothetical protein
MIPGPNWARRYRSQQTRSCGRPGCGAPAAATLRFRPTQREAWLVDVEDTRARTEGDLCARHADSLALPRGWSLFDARTIVDGPRQPRRPRPRPELVIVPDPPEPEQHAVTLPMPTALTRDAIGDMLDARTPLLRRAFQNVLPVDGS